MLQSENLNLRAVEPSDIDFMWRVESDRSQWLDNGNTAPYSQSQIVDYVMNYKADPMREGELRLIIEHDGETIGIADLYNLNVVSRTGWIGIYLNPESRGYGHARKTLALLSDYAFNILHMRCLGAKIAEPNKACISLFESGGFEHVGSLKKWLLADEAVDVLIYQLNNPKEA